MNHNSTKFIFIMLLFSICWIPHFGVMPRASMPEQLSLLLKITTCFLILFFICWIPHAEGILARAAQKSLLLIYGSKFDNYTLFLSCCYFSFVGFRNMVQNSAKSKMNIQRRAGFFTT